MEQYYHEAHGKQCGNRNETHARRRRIRVRRMKIILFIFACIIALLIAGKQQNISEHGDDQSLWQTSKTNTVLLQGDTGSEKAKDTVKISVDIVATNAFVTSIDSNTVLYQKNSAEHIAPASTAKMLTALTVLDYCSLDDTFTVGSEIKLIAPDSSTAWLYVGDTLTLKQLLVALLLPSGNDAAYTIAVNAGKRMVDDDSLTIRQAVEVFVDAMNQKARDIRASSSNFMTPDGYDVDGQYTTAFDLAQIAKSYLCNDILVEIASSYRISDTWMNGREVTYYNTNELLNPDSPYYYPKAIGLKTGNSGNAGSCLVSAAIINGKTYICVIMGSSEKNRCLDSLNIYNEIERQ